MINFIDVFSGITLSKEQMDILASKALAGDFCKVAEHYRDPVTFTQTVFENAELLKLYEDKDKEKK